MKEERSKRANTYIECTHFTATAILRSSVYIQPAIHQSFMFHASSFVALFAVSV